MTAMNILKIISLNCSPYPTVKVAYSAAPLVSQPAASLARPTTLPSLNSPTASRSRSLLRVFESSNALNNTQMLFLADGGSIRVMLEGWRLLCSRLMKRASSDLMSSWRTYKQAELCGLQICVKLSLWYCYAASFYATGHTLLSIAGSNNHDPHTMKVWKACCFTKSAIVIVVPTLQRVNPFQPDRT